MSGINFIPGRGFHDFESPETLQFIPTRGFYQGASLDDPERTVLLARCSWPDVVEKCAVFPGDIARSVKFRGDIAARVRFYGC